MFTAISIDMQMWSFVKKFIFILNFNRFINILAPYFIVIVI